MNKRKRNTMSYMYAQAPGQIDQQNHNQILNQTHVV